MTDAMAVSSRVASEAWDRLRLRRAVECGGAGQRRGKAAMLRFTLREILLLTAFVATVIAWRQESWAHDRSRQRTRSHAERLRVSLGLAKSECDQLTRWIIEGRPRETCGSTYFEGPEWALAQQPIP